LDVFLGWILAFFAFGTLFGIIGAAGLLVLLFRRNGLGIAVYERGLGSSNRARELLEGGEEQTHTEAATAELDDGDVAASAGKHMATEPFRGADTDDVFAMGKTTASKQSGSASLRRRSLAAPFSTGFSYRSQDSSRLSAPAEAPSEQREATTKPPALPVATRTATTAEKTNADRPSASPQSEKSGAKKTVKDLSALFGETPALQSTTEPIASRNISDNPVPKATGVSTPEKTATRTSVTPTRSSAGVAEPEKPVGSARKSASGQPPAAPSAQPVAQVTGAVKSAGKPTASVTRASAISQLADQPARKGQRESATGRAASRPSTTPMPAVERPAAAVSVQRNAKPVKASVVDRVTPNKKIARAAGPTSAPRAAVAGSTTPAQEQEEKPVAGAFPATTEAGPVAAVGGGAMEATAAAAKMSQSSPQETSPAKMVPGVEAPGATPQLTTSDKGEKASPAQPVQPTEPVGASEKQESTAVKPESTAVKPEAIRDDRAEPKQDNRPASSMHDSSGSKRSSHIEPSSARLGEPLLPTQGSAVTDAADLSETAADPLAQASSIVSEKVSHRSASLDYGSSPIAVTRVEEKPVDVSQLRETHQVGTSAEQNPVASEHKPNKGVFQPLQQNLSATDPSFTRTKARMAGVEDDGAPVNNLISRFEDSRNQASNKKPVAERINFAGPARSLLAKRDPGNILRTEYVGPVARQKKSTREAVRGEPVPSEAAISVYSQEALKNETAANVKSLREQVEASLNPNSEVSTKASEGAGTDVTAQEEIVSKVMSEDGSFHTTAVSSVASERHNTEDALQNEQPREEASELPAPPEMESVGPIDEVANYDPEDDEIGDMDDETVNKALNNTYHNFGGRGTRPMSMDVTRARPVSLDENGARARARAERERVNPRPSTIEPPEDGGRRKSADVFASTTTPRVWTNETHGAEKKVKAIKQRFKKMLKMTKNDGLQIVCEGSATEMIGKLTRAMRLVGAYVAIRDGRSKIKVGHFPAMTGRELVLSVEVRNTVDGRCAVFFRRSMDDQGTVTSEEFRRFVERTREELHMHM